MNTQILRCLALLILTTTAAFGVNLVVDDFDGTLGATRAPVIANVKLNRNALRAAAEGRLQLHELGTNGALPSPAVPAQLFVPARGVTSTRLCWMMPPGPKGKRSFKIQIGQKIGTPAIDAKPSLASGQFDITDSSKLVLRYNYATIEPGDILINIAPANHIYARARSDYIHPLFGFDGETLTKDWSVDHPHHRGIYWAWPEVDWHGQRGDLHALQKVFARPIGKCVTTSGLVFAQIEAENLWKWESDESLVHERAVIRAYRSTGDDRLLDLEFQFTALNETVSIARRGTDKYGGLNIRLAQVSDQVITFHTDPTNAVMRSAWAGLSGTFGESKSPCSLVVLQHQANPDYPGEWVKFPELNRFQPTFPASRTRYELRKGQPLILRFRLWLHRGSLVNEEYGTAQWRAYHSSQTPRSMPHL